MNRLKRIVLSSIIVLSILILASCSFKIAHADGMSTYIGVLRVNDASDSAPVVHTQRLGMGVDLGKNQNGVMLGIEDKLVVVPENNSTGEYEYSYSRGVLGEKSIAGKYER